MAFWSTNIYRLTSYMLENGTRWDTAPLPPPVFPALSLPLLVLLSGFHLMKWKGLTKCQPLLTKEEKNGNSHLKTQTHSHLVTCAAVPLGTERSWRTVVGAKDPRPPLGCVCRLQGGPVLCTGSSGQGTAGLLSTCCRVRVQGFQRALHWTLPHSKVRSEKDAFVSPRLLVGSDTQPIWDSVWSLAPFLLLPCMSGRSVSQSLGPGCVERGRLGCPTSSCRRPGGSQSPPAVWESQGSCQMQFRTNLLSVRPAPAAELSGWGGSLEGEQRGQHPRQERAGCEARAAAREWKRAF